MTSDLNFILSTYSIRTLLDNHAQPRVIKIITASFPTPLTLNAPRNTITVPSKPTFYVFDKLTRSNKLDHNPSKLFCTLLTQNSYHPSRFQNTNFRSPTSSRYPLIDPHEKGTVPMASKKADRPKTDESPSSHEPNCSAALIFDRISGFN